MKLTVKQQRFVDCYDGNATQAALKAGYSKRTAPFIGAENLKKPQIAAALAERESKSASSNIATREERQAFWSSVLRSEAEQMKDRLKASELLGKSNADFIDRFQQDGPVEINIKIVSYADKP